MSAYDCAGRERMLKRDRDVGWERGIITVIRSIAVLPRDVPKGVPMKNRWARPVAVHEGILALLEEQLTMLRRADAVARSMMCSEVPRRAPPSRVIERRW